MPLRTPLLCLPLAVAATCSRGESPVSLEDVAIHHGNTSHSTLGAREDGPFRCDHVRLRLKKEGQHELASMGLHGLRRVAASTLGAAVTAPVASSFPKKPFEQERHWHHEEIEWERKSPRRRAAGPPSLLTPFPE
ncbi:hypothetical protein Cni_G09502 [Canna indica]|uniref:Uncharacterized protein n=1 Tax=Canna indica TaxID=4628 RepID=A0AAQ3K2F9_9LILI|nr:hypothetical protein Cni_G09502 [Canna indica]